MVSMVSMYHLDGVKTALW